MLLADVVRFAEAHIKYGGMGTMLVIKVGVLTPNKLIYFIKELFIYLATLLLFSEAVSFLVILSFKFSPCLGCICRFLLNLPTSLVSWLLILSPKNCCITLRNRRLLYVQNAVNV